MAGQYASDVTGQRLHHMPAHHPCVHSSVDTVSCGGVVAAAAASSRSGVAFHARWCRCTLSRCHRGRGSIHAICIHVYRCWRLLAWKVCGDAVWVPLRQEWRKHQLLNSQLSCASSPAHRLPVSWCHICLSGLAFNAFHQAHGHCWLGSQLAFRRFINTSLLQSLPYPCAVESRSIGLCNPDSPADHSRTIGVQWLLLIRTQANARSGWHIDCLRPAFDTPTDINTWAPSAHPGPVHRPRQLRCIHTYHSIHRQTAQQYRSSGPLVGFGACASLSSGPMLLSGRQSKHALNIVDRPISKNKLDIATVSFSAYAYLFSELISYSVDRAASITELEDR